MIITSRSTKWWSPGLSRAFAIMIMLFLSALAQAETSIVIPHVGERAREQFQQYQYSPKHKAFAIAPGGAWYWLTELESEEQAEQQVLQNCQENTQQKCVLYALDNRIVFDADKWPSLWGPYADAATASKATEGVNVGQRFPDLTWRDNKDKQIPLSSLKGKITFLHFWGSWCPPCMREFPSLNKLQAEMKKRYPDDVAMVLMQLREPFEKSIEWAQQYGFSGMPLYDSGVKDSETTTLMLKDGRQVKDREIARVFPSTYVLDRNGLVLFSHYGPVGDWLDYVAFFDHAVKTGASASTGTKYRGKPGS